MTDPNLFAFGGVVMFCALAGAYLYIRGRSSGMPKAPSEAERSVSQAALHRVGKV